MAANQARANAEAYLRTEYKLDLRITAFDPRVSANLWPKEMFDWANLLAHDFGPGTLEVFVWVDGVLEVAAICTAHGSQVIVRHVEGRPGGNQALKGQRLWVVLEVAANFATGLGKTEIWWHPATEAFLNFCVSTIGAERRGKQCMFRIPT